MAHQLSSEGKTRSTVKSSTRVGTLVTLLTVAALLAGCGADMKASVNSACDVFTDSLRDVRSTNPNDDDRISKHFEAGVAAGCWKRK